METYFSRNMDKVPFFRSDKGKVLLFNIHPAVDLDFVQDELEQIKYFFGEGTKVIVISEQYIDELVQLCEYYMYDAYVLDADGTGILNEAAENILAGNFYLSKNVLKAYLKSRSSEYDRRQPS